MRVRLRAATAVIAAALTGCGYIGDPLPPALNIPLPAANLRASQLGGKVIIRFTLPDLTTDGVGIDSLGEVELRAAETGPPGNIDEWASSATRIDVSQLQSGPVEVTAPATKWAERTMHLAVRAASRKRRWSAWSPVVRLQVVTPLATPSPPALALVPRGVQVSWPALQRSGAKTRVLRWDPDAAAPLEAAVVEGAMWVDSAVRTGAAYRYALQTSLTTAQGEIDSEQSPAASIEIVDKFAPAAPAGLTAVQGIGSIELAWDRGPEPDLVGFRLYRSEAGGEFSAVTPEVIRTASFSDRGVKLGVAYRYAVASVDDKGNESARSAPVEIVAR